MKYLLQLVVCCLVLITTRHYVLHIQGNSTEPANVMIEPFQKLNVSAVIPTLLSEDSEREIRKEEHTNSLSTEETRPHSHFNAVEITSVKSSHTVPEETTTEPSLTQNESVKEQKRRRLMEKMFTPERAERNAKIDAPKEAARNGDWDEFIKAAVELQSLSDYMFDTTLKSAISYDAPRYVFEELLARGARFNYLHLALISRTDKIPMMQMLMELGLDIHMQTPQGDNAINLILRTVSARDMFKFLLYQGVEVQNGSLAHDPLMESLLKAEQQHQAIFFAYQLIRYGERPGSEHLKQAQQLQSINPRAFQLIQKNVPELLGG